MAFGLSKSGKQVFTANGTWTHPMPGVELSVTMLLVGGGGGGQGSTNGASGSSTSATIAGGTTYTAAGGAGGGLTRVASAGAVTMPTLPGPAGFGNYGLGGHFLSNSYSIGQSGETKLVTVTTTADITLTFGAGGKAGTDGGAGYAGIVIVEW